MLKIFIFSLSLFLMLEAYASNNCSQLFGVSPSGQIKEVWFTYSPDKYLVGKNIETVKAYKRFNSIKVFFDRLSTYPLELVMGSIYKSKVSFKGPQKILQMDSGKRINVDEYSGLDGVVIAQTKDKLIIKSDFLGKPEYYILDMSNSQRERSLEERMNNPYPVKFENIPHDVRLIFKVNSDHDSKPIDYSKELEAALKIPDIAKIILEND